MTNPDKRCGTCRNWAAFIDERQRSDFVITLSDNGACDLDGERTTAQSTCPCWEGGE